MLSWKPTEWTIEIVKHRYYLIEERDGSLVCSYRAFARHEELGASLLIADAVQRCRAHFEKDREGELVKLPKLHVCTWEAEWRDHTFLVDVDPEGGAWAGVRRDVGCYVHKDLGEHGSLGEALAACEAHAPSLREVAA